MSKVCVLVGSFVKLRPLQVDDASLTLGWRSSGRARVLNAGTGSLKEQVAWIKTRPRTDFNFVIELNGGPPVGMLSLVEVSSANRHAETAHFLIGDEQSVKGIPAAVEAMKLLYEFAFDELQLLRLYGTVASDNSLMVKWQKYLGMKEEGRLRSHYFLDGKWQDAIILGLLIEEYRTISLPRMIALLSATRR